MTNETAIFSPRPPTSFSLSDGKLAPSFLIPPSRLGPVIDCETVHLIPLPPRRPAPLAAPFLPTLHRHPPQMPPSLCHLRFKIPQRSLPRNHQQLLALCYWSDDCRRGHHHHLPRNEVAPALASHKERRVALPRGGPKQPRPHGGQAASTAEHATAGSPSNLSTCGDEGQARSSTSSGMAPGASLLPVVSSETKTLSLGPHMGLRSFWAEV